VRIATDVALEICAEAGSNQPMDFCGCLRKWSELAAIHFFVLGFRSGSKASTQKWIKIDRLRYFDMLKRVKTAGILPE